MEKLTDTDQIITAELQEGELDEAIQYATISLPWTFDRMGYGGRSQNGVNRRILNILKGVLNQTVLDRVLTERGYDCEKDWTRYRDTDVFDFKIGDNLYDVKTVQVFHEYNDEWDRDPFSPEMLIENRDYPGPRWRSFFPVTVPLTQLSVSTGKDAFIFGTAETHEDFRTTEPEVGDGGYWITAPHGDAFKFFHNKHAINEREEEGDGFNVTVEWESQQTTLESDDGPIDVTLIGEWMGDRVEEELTVEKNESVVSDTEFSSLSSLRAEHPAQLTSDDKLLVSAQTNYDDRIPKPTNPSTDLNNDDFEWELTDESFVNLRVPDDYKIHWTGYIPHEEYFEAFQKYEAYFIPKGDNMDVNQKARLTEDLKTKFERIDRRREKAIEEGEDVSRPEFMSFTNGEDEEINAGLLIAAYRGPRPIGAACYFYPPYALRESAMYILPQDLYTIDSI